MTDLNATARTVLERRYLRRDEQGNLVESPSELWHRVAEHVAAVEEQFDARDSERVKDRFRELLENREFLPNSPTLMNAGTELNQLGACFVLPVHDSIESIFEAVKQTALIHQSGGGTGFSFSEIRPSGDTVSKTGGVASGPVSFMRIIDSATQEIKQGGRRRGANMGVLRVDHPDIVEFIESKKDSDSLKNFNLSVATTDRFWTAYERGQSFPLINPRTGEVSETVDPSELLDRMAEAAWGTGDPGLLFLDTINEQNPTPDQGDLTATNPCGEVPLLPYEACVLGSIDLSKMTDGSSVDWNKLERTAQLGVRFLDNAITASQFPVDEIETMMEANRKIGLGVMGFHDMLIDLGVSYDSDRAVEWAERIMGRIQETARDASRSLAKERKPFPNWRESLHEKPIRNATRTTIAPTGTISLLANCSSGIEPIYNVAYTKQVMGGLDVRSDRFLELARDRGFYSDELMNAVRSETSLQPFDDIPDDVKNLFPTAHDVPAKQHLRIQSAFQKHVDNAVSKTINLPEEASIGDVRSVFLEAREQNIKGITVFRSQSRPEQVLGEDPLKEECVSECEYSARQ